MSGSNLRVVTLNFWGTEPPLERRLELAVRQLRALAPDVICMQEVRPLDGVFGRTTADVIAEQLDMYALYAKSCEWQAGDASMTKAGQEGLAIITRAPVEESRNLALPEPRTGCGKSQATSKVNTLPVSLRLTNWQPAPGEEPNKRLGSRASSAVRQRVCLKLVGSRTPGNSVVAVMSQFPGSMSAHAADTKTEQTQINHNARRINRPPDAARGA